VKRGGAVTRLSKEKRQRIVELLRDGAKQDAIAAEVGCSQPMVSKVRVAAFGSSRRRLRADKRRMVAMMVADGWRHRWIADVVGISTSLVSMIAVGAR
jgi:uncharacterized protein YerC